MAWLIIPYKMADLEHSHYSVGSGESTSDSSRGAEPFAIVKSIHMPSGFSRNKWQKVISTLRRSGMTLQLSDDPKLKRSDPLRPLPEASPVRTFPAPAKEPDSKGSGPGCSSRLPGSFAWYDRSSSSWKTYQRCLYEGWVEYLESFPKAGMMRDGACYQRLRWELPIKEIASGLWPTPRASVPSKGSPSRGAVLSEIVEKSTMRGRAINIVWPTPSARDWKSSNASLETMEKNTRPLNETVTQGSGGQLNPTWVEWLMGYPLGWTDLGA